MIAQDKSKSLRAVPALLCRLGIRPHSWSPLAPSLVADHMAVLSHMNCTNDQFVGSYSSEPILTFGAAHVWYKSVFVRGTSKYQLLEYRLLPELRKMLYHEALAIGEPSKIVASIVLLLAMDATGVVATGDEGQRCYDGKFYSVADFLRTVSGDSDDARTERGEARDVETLLEPWASWKVGFSHFVEVSQEPTKEALWAMLARRSACILPRSFKGTDLLIPMFTPSDVSNVPAISMIVIEVRDLQTGDTELQDSATTSGCSNLTFGGELRSLANHEVVRIYMSFRAGKMEQFFVVDTGIRESLHSDEKTIKAETIVRTEGPPEPGALVLCIQGLDAWFAKHLDEGSTPNADENDEACEEEGMEVERTQPDKLKTVISNGVATQLKSLLDPHWELEAIVLADLDSRSDSYGMDREEVIQTANRPMVKTVLARTWNYRTTNAEALFNTTMTTMSRLSAIFAPQPNQSGRSREDVNRHLAGSYSGEGRAMQLVHLPTHQHSHSWCIIRT